MTRERVARAASGRFTPMIHCLSTALGSDPVAALVYQQLFFWSGIEADADGWLEMSEARMASEIHGTRHAAREALLKLVEEDEVVECQEGSGSRPDRYRVCQDKLRELLPFDASPQPQITVDPQPQTPSPKRVSGKSLSHAHANEGKMEGSNELTTEGENEDKTRPPYVGSNADSDTEREPASGQEDPSGNDNGPEDAPSPPVGAQLSDTSSDDGSGKEGVDSAAAINAVVAGFGKPQKGGAGSEGDAEEAARLTAETKQRMRGNR